MNLNFAGFIFAPPINNGSFFPLRFMTGTLDYFVKVIIALISFIDMCLKGEKIHFCLEVLISRFKL